MPFADISDPSAIIQSIQRFNDLGRDVFLSEYGFGKAKQYFIQYKGSLYDSKAIVGVAHGYQFPDLGPLNPSDFSGGDLTVKKKLEELGFEVIVTGDDFYTSSALTVGKIYSRAELKAKFDISDATINTGIFQPKGHRSIWLFVTENKTPDRTQYNDVLIGNTLHWQGQTSGRKDSLIIEHKKSGLELLLFYRQEKYEYPGAAFRYEGIFRYINHKGMNPTSFVLHRDTVDLGEEAFVEDVDAAFNPSSIEDARKKISRAIYSRQGQQAFRSSLLRAYEGKCAISGCDVLETLEAAHIYPYKGEETNHVTNGLLLRADIHTLFDLGLISIDSGTNTVIIATTLKGTLYDCFDCSPISMPTDNIEQPSKEALDWHKNESGL